MINRIGPHKFIFIDIPKNASSSIRDCLMSDLNIKYEPMNFNICPNHESASLYVNHNFNSDDYFKFGFVRNPWDRVVSMYEYSRTKTHGKHITSFENFVKFMYESFINKKPNERDPVLGDVNQDYVTANGENVSLNWKTQIGWLRVNDKQFVDFIGRFENIHEDMGKIYQLMGIDKKPNLTKVNKSQRNKDYRGYYNDEFRDMIYEINKEDIILFDYKF